MITCWMKMAHRFWLLAKVLAVASATKDDSYYPNGIVNPNVDRDMYWHDASNVLQDLDQFAELYVQFHSCAWSPFVYETSNPKEDDDMDETDYWYMDAMPKYGPNIAYSLYGVLQGEKSSGCNKKTYINSFYTTSGFPTFANTLATAGISNTGTKFSTDCENGVGLACYDNTGSSTFVMMDYNGQCKPENAKRAYVPSDVALFNSVLKNEAQCAKIYSSGDAAPEVLQYSRVCSLGDFVGACPDPFKMKTMYERELMKLEVPSSFYYKQIKQGSILFAIGIFLFAVAGLILHQGRKSFPLPPGFKYVKKPKLKAKSKAKREKKSRKKDKLNRRREKLDLDEELRRIESKLYGTPNSLRESEQEACLGSSTLEYGICEAPDEEQCSERMNGPASPPVERPRAESIDSEKCVFDMPAPLDRGATEHDHEHGHKNTTEPCAPVVSLSLTDDLEEHREARDAMLRGLKSWLGDKPTGQP